MHLTGLLYLVAIIVLFSPFSAKWIINCSVSSTTTPLNHPTIPPFTNPTTTRFRSRMLNVTLSDYINVSSTTAPGGITQPHPDLTQAKTISSTFNNIMSTYDKKFRPTYGASPTDVQLELFILSFADPNESEMEYTVDMYFAQLWFDHRFNVSSTQPNAIVELIGSQVEDVWLPDTIFLNSKKSKFHHVTIDNRFLQIYIGYHGLVIYHTRLTMTASCHMNLRLYPFDTQTCFLAVTSHGHEKKDVTYTWESIMCGDKCKLVKVYDKEMANWNLISAEKTNNKTMYATDDKSSRSIFFIFKRLQNFFILRIYVPSIMIVMVSWTTFWISQDAVPARASICILSILTLITMLGVVNTNMPRVSYIKSLDLYLLVSFIFVFCALIEYMLVMNMKVFLKSQQKKMEARTHARQERQRESMKEKQRHYTTKPFSDSGEDIKDDEYAKTNVDHHSNQTKTGVGFISNNNDEGRMANPFLATPKTSAPPRRFRIRSLRFRGKRGTALSSLLKEENPNWIPKKYIAHGKPTHIIDYTARMLFPLTFGIFNAVYWLYGL